MAEVRFGPYRLIELLGRGGMGEVYRAHDSETDRVVALKLLPEHLVGDAEYVARFTRECRVAARLREAHVVPIHRYGEIDGRLYLDMRLIDGVDLGAWLAEHGPLPAPAAVAVLDQVAQALDAAHADGLVHRDVKPSNVLLVGARTPVDPARLFAYLFDFGIARPSEAAVGPDAAVLTRAGTVPGSPPYLAPERLSGTDAGPAADVYALACVLFEALTGRPPFTGTLAVVLRGHVLDTPPRPSIVRSGVPASFDAVVARGMAKEPGERYRSAADLATAARAALGSDLDTMATMRTGSDLADAVTVAQPRTDDAITVRFGGGVPAAATGLDVTAPPAPRVPAARRGGRGRLIGGTLVTGLIVAAILAFVFLVPREPLAVLGATVAPAVDPGRGCDVTVDVVGTVQTNGNAGTITYEWTRSDGETSGVLTETVASGQATADVHLLWSLSGQGRYNATATLRILEPAPLDTAGTFTYDCR